MIEALYDIEQSGEDLQRFLTEHLGLQTAVPQSVLERARRDDKFASLLFRVAAHPHLIDVVLREQDHPVVKPAIQTTFTNTGLLKKGTSSLLKWGLTGFSTVPQAEFESRMSVCEGCPDLIAAPDMAAYKIKLSAKADMRVCSLCGCVASRKAKLSSETCPANKWNVTQ